MPSRLFRIGIIYRWQMGRWPQLSKPSRFTEHVQVRKLAGRDPRFVTLSDKVSAKAHVAEVLGSSWVTPTLWYGSELPATPPGNLPLVVKARHGCGQVAFIRNASDWDRAKRKARQWMRRGYGRWLDEWAYRHIPRGVLVEPMIGDGLTLPLDYKFIVIGGRVQCVEVHLDRAHHHRWIVVDRDWVRLSRAHADDCERPSCLDAMIAGAERLGQGHDCVRVDLYALDGCPRFGEMTFYPGSGVLPIDPPELDVALGEAWSRVKDC